MDIQLSQEHALMLCISLNDMGPDAGFNHYMMRILWCLCKYSVTSESCFKERLKFKRGLEFNSKLKEKVSNLMTPFAFLKTFIHKFITDDQQEVTAYVRL
jgi:hypothetical protein